jgi:hypothetical protein
MKVVLGNSGYLIVPARLQLKSVAATLAVVVTDTENEEGKPLLRRTRGGWGRARCPAHTVVDHRDEKRWIR